MTFHRIKNFRQLTMDDSPAEFFLKLQPEAPAESAQP